jgi:hypothetical protein
MVLEQRLNRNVWVTAVLGKFTNYLFAKYNNMLSCRS